MLNGQLSDGGYATHLTQIASYFDIVDSAVKTADTNKRYTISTNVSTAPSPPIGENSWTHVHIAPTCDNMCDLYNSYIVAEMEVKLKVTTNSGTISKANCNNSPSVWVGFKDSLQAISQYQIISNGTSVYDQTHAIEEAYITSLAAPDAVIDRDVFSKCSMRGIHKRPECLMTGALVDLTNTGEQTVKIALKIDIRRFLPLASVKYLPAFVGNLELRLRFSTDGMVCCPMPYTDVITNPATRHAITSMDTYNTSFMPIGEKIKVIGNYTSNKITAAEVTINKTGLSVVTCYSILACFGIDDSIYQSLISRYSGQSLSFPTQTLSFHQMDGKIEGSDTAQTSFNLALTITPRFVDTIFFLFPTKPNFKSVYFNPLFDEVRLYMGGYGTMPDQSMTSYGMVAYEMTQNALNMNNDIMGMNEGVMRSQIVTPATKVMDQALGYEANDISNYVLAFPTSTDNTFQQGQTSASPITYELKGQINKNTPLVKNSSQCVPLMGLLKDSVFAIQIRPNGPPIVALDEFDIASPAGK